MEVRIFLLIIVITGVSGTIDLIHCRHPLGMQDKRIPDGHLTASSFHAPGTGPSYGRFGREDGDGAWCPKGILYPGEQKHWLQIKLPSLSYISVVATQGRDAHGLGQEYTPNYKLNYSRDGDNWFEWKNFRGNMILKGNDDARSNRRQKLNPGIVSASYVRFIPQTSSSISACARIELFGCKIQSGVLQYTIPSPGNTDELSTMKGEKWSFDDEFYDGRRERLSYHGGLGQLTDGVVGSDNIRQVKSAVSSPDVGFDYVGWQNNNHGDRYVTLTFFFQDVQKFSNMAVYCLSSPTAGSSFPSSITVSFSLNGRTFQSTSHASRVAYNVPNAVGTEARAIVVPLGEATARYVQAQFRIRGDWLLISEIDFDTEISVGNEIPKDEEDGNFAKSEKERTLVTPATESSVIPTGPSTIAIVIGTLAVVILLLVFVLVLLAYRHRRLKKTMSPPRYSYAPAAPRTPTAEPNVTLCLADQRATFTSTNSSLPEKFADPVYHEITGGPSILMTNGYQDPCDVVQPRVNLPELTRFEERNRRYEQPDVTMCATGVMAVSHYAETAITPSLPPYETNIQGPFGNSVYAVPWNALLSNDTRGKNTPPPQYTPTSSETSTLLADDYHQYDGSFHADLPNDGNNIIEVRRDRLEFIEKLGEGQFGEVHLCKTYASLGRHMEQTGLSTDRRTTGPVLVAAKVLRKDTSSHAKEDFLKEMKIMSRLHDPNIIKLLAVCTETEPFMMITEYMENGDLHEYLKKFEFNEYSLSMSEEPRTSGNTPNSYSPNVDLCTLLSMAAQIAGGMKYLSSLNFIHRDLATRNCLVGRNHTIRVADFGMSRNMYQGDYYKIHGNAVLPIRWMSWECVLLGKFSTASDVWAFGVTLWEIFTLCKCQPYYSMQDDEVVKNMYHIHERTGEEVYLAKPIACPTSLFNLIRQCWSRETEERPSFKVLHSFLTDMI